MYCSLLKNGLAEVVVLIHRGPYAQLWADKLIPALVLNKKDGVRWFSKGERKREWGEKNKKNIDGEEQIGEYGIKTHLNGH